MPVPQENSLFVEQASCLSLENGARCELKPTTECDEKAINCSPLKEDFRCETGVFNPCRTGSQTRDSIENMNTAEPSLTKTELRKSLLNTRKSLSAQEWRQKRRSPLQPPAKLALIHRSKNNPRLLQLSPRTRFKSPIYIFCGGGILAAQFWRQARCLSHKSHSHP